MIMMFTSLNQLFSLIMFEHLERIAQQNLIALPENQRFYDLLLKAFISLIMSASCENSV